VEQHTTTSPTKRHRVEGPKNHYLTYIVSIFLTMLAFAAVLYGGLDKSFLVAFLVFIAIIQIVFQMGVWMHMKERGHIFPIVGIIFGFFVALSGVTAALYWMWW
jgi:cytochrome c oxidase subunit 4